MSEAMSVDIFVEDRAHEAFMSALLRRLATEANRMIRLRTRTARGGHGRVLSELSLYQRSALKQFGGMAIPDFLVVATDANCASHQKASRDVQAELLPSFADRAVIACPDPHVESWYLADLDSFAQVVGIRPRVSAGKCERDYYKRVLAKAVVDAGHPPTLGGIEFAFDIVAQMDFYRAGKSHHSLRHVVDQTRKRLTAAGTY